MFSVTDVAAEVIKEFLKDKEEPHFVRLMLVEGGCCGPTLGMALDELRENDEVFNEKGVNFLIEKGLFEEIKPISIDFVRSPMGSGFMVQSELSRKGGCGSSCSC